MTYVLFLFKQQRAIVQRFGTSKMKLSLSVLGYLPCLGGGSVVVELLFIVIYVGSVFGPVCVMQDLVSYLVLQ